MIKIVFFDFDGVLTVTGHACSEICSHLEPVAKLPADKIEPVFHKIAKQLLVNGKRYRDYIDVINNELDTHLTADDILEAVQKSKLNPEMVNLLRDLKKKGTRVGILTDNNIERLEMIRNHSEFGSLSLIVGSSEAGCTKDKCEVIFTQTLKEAQVSPEEVLFIDNKRECLVIPKEIGFHPEFPLKSQHPGKA
ncbi:MAG TPA: HAD family hydrolase [Candidatus Limnocylindria bacterium]|nr:HAD family hydrolase [Candidatus Limnocylindria bacterium]